MKQKSILSRTRRSSSGFTLVELLVVVTIIIVLAGVGYPTIGKMRASAARSQCITRLKEWGVAMGGYAADHDGKLNFEHWVSISNEEKKCSPYVHYWSGASVNFNEDGSSGNNDDVFSIQRRMRRCPAIKVKENEFPVHYSTIQPVGVAKVGIGGRIEGKSSDYNLARINNTGRFLLMIETMEPSGNTGYSVSTAADFQSRVKPLTQNGVNLRHNNTVNALFADYSVQPMNWKQIEKGLGYWTTF